MEHTAQLIAKDLLQIKAVFFRPEEPFTWPAALRTRATATTA